MDAPKPKIYVASSWRNLMQQGVVHALRATGVFDVYDFKNPDPNGPPDNGFHWSEIDKDWKNWTPEAFRDSLTHPIAEYGFGRDMDALIACDLCVLVMPCGRSAHLEAGYAIGTGKPTAILLSDGEPELMYKMAATICTSLYELIGWCERVGSGLTLETEGRNGTSLDSLDPSIEPSADEPGYTDWKSEAAP